MNCHSAVDRPGQHKGADENDDADGNRRDDAEAIGDLADDDAAKAEAEEDHGRGKRDRATGAPRTPPG